MSVVSCWSSVVGCMRNSWKVVVLLLGVHALLLAWSAARQSPTWDEPCHLAAGLCRLQYGRFDLDPGNPPLLGTAAAAPVLLVGADVRWGQTCDTLGCPLAFLAANGRRSLWLVTLGHWTCIPFSLLGGYVSFRSAHDLYGGASGLLALALWCFCPCILANGALVTGDMAATASGILAFYAFWKWLCRPSWSGAFVTGVLLGIAELAKYVWVFLFLLWPVLWLAWRWPHRGEAGVGVPALAGDGAGNEQGKPPECGTPTGREVSRSSVACLQRSFVRETGQGLVIVVLAVYVINLGYLFGGPFHPLAEFSAGRRVLKPLDGAPQLARTAGAIPLPLPADYVSGIDAIEAGA